ncbi:MAG: GFA family protein [Pseudomonadota bacterium]|nr:GFA family protein [Pseudomonadota bacterium]
MTGEGATNLPKLPWTGGCQCGALRYAITGAPRTLYACHCTECRRQSASAHGLSLWVREADFTLSGESRHWSRTADSGHLMHCFFCPHCGARLYHKSGEEPADPRKAILSVKAGTLDHARLLGPVGHIWTRSKMAGTLIPDGALAFDTEPDDFATLVEAFSRAYAIPE